MLVEVKVEDVIDAVTRAGQPPSRQRHRQSWTESIDAAFATVRSAAEMVLSNFTALGPDTVETSPA